MGNDLHLPVFAWTVGGFTLELRGHPTGRDRTPLAYRLREHVRARTGAPATVFAGADLSVCTGADLDAVAAGLCAYFTLVPGDLHPDYIRRYSGHQLPWPDARAADLGACLTRWRCRCSRSPLEGAGTDAPARGPLAGPSRV